jgi:hypothetical protein
MELVKMKVISTLGDLKDIKFNLKEDFPLPMRLSGIIKLLIFNPREWKWLIEDKERPFFTYSAKIGYQSGLVNRKQDSHPHEKLKAFKLTTAEIQASIVLIWDCNKPAKL